jgi:hypothetical protein
MEQILQAFQGAAKGAFTFSGSKGMRSSLLRGAINMMKMTILPLVSSQSYRLPETRSNVSFLALLAGMHGNKHNGWYVELCATWLASLDSCMYCRRRSATNRRPSHRYFGKTLKILMSKVLEGALCK